MKYVLKLRCLLRAGLFFNFGSAIPTNSKQKSVADITIWNYVCCNVLAGRLAVVAIACT